MTIFNANETGMGAPRASNITPEKVLAPNGTAPSEKTNNNNPYGFSFFISFLVNYPNLEV